MRHLLNLAQKLEAWKEKCRENETKRRIAKLKADIIRIQGPDAENNNEQKTDAEDEVVQQEQEQEKDNDDVEETNEEFWLDLSSALLFLISLFLILTTCYI